MKTITAQQLSGMKGKRTFIDVRTPAEFSEIHIPGSRLVPFHTIDTAKAQEVAHASDSYVVICASGKRAVQAAQKLEAAGVKDLLVLEGGVTAWNAGGFEVTKGKKTMSIERQVRIGAGGLVVGGIILGLAVNPLFFFVSGLVGCGLVFAGLTDWCGMGIVLARMPWNNRGGACSADGGAAVLPKSS